MKLGFTTLGCPKWNLDKIAEFAGQNGFDGVELRTSKDGVHLRQDAPVQEAERVGKLFRSKGTRVFSLMAYPVFGSDDPAQLAANRDLLLHVLDLAKAIGADFVRTFGGEFTGRKTREKALSDASTYLTPCAEKARKIGVALGVETHDDWCDAANIRDLQRAVGGGLGAVWDFTNVVHHNGMSAAQQYAQLGPTVLYCHVKDSVKRADGKHHYVLVGSGEMPVREVVSLLRKDKRDIFLSLEHEKMWVPELAEPEEALPAYVKFMRGLDR